MCGWNAPRPPQRTFWTTTQNQTEFWFWPVCLMELLPPAGSHLYCSCVTTQQHVLWCHMFSSIIKTIQMKHTWRASWSDRWILRVRLSEAWRWLRHHHPQSLMSSNHKQQCRRLQQVQSELHLVSSLKGRLSLMLEVSESDQNTLVWVNGLSVAVPTLCLLKAQTEVPHIFIYLSDRPQSEGEVSQDACCCL